MLKTSKIIVNQAAICACLNLSHTQVQDLQKDGVIIRTDKNKYDLIKSISNYVKRLKGQEKFDLEEGGVDYYSERSRLTKAQADERELKVLKESGELVSIKVAEQVWCDAAILLRNNVLAVPSKVCRKAAESQNENEIEDIVKSELILALTGTNIDPSKYIQDEEPHSFDTEAKHLPHAPA